MTITEIRIELDERNGDRGGLAGTAEITFDYELVVKEVKIIRDPSNKDQYFLEFHRRAFVEPCPRCFKPNALSAHYCWLCGRALNPQPDRMMPTAHPVSTTFRRYVTSMVLEAYRTKKAKHLLGAAHVQ